MEQGGRFPVPLSRFRGVHNVADHYIRCNECRVGYSTNIVEPHEVLPVGGPSVYESFITYQTCNQHKSQALHDEKRNDGIKYWDPPNAD